MTTTIAAPRRPLVPQTVIRSQVGPRCARADAQAPRIIEASKDKGETGSLRNPTPSETESTHRITAAKSKLPAEPAGADAATPDPAATPATGAPATPPVAGGSAAGRSVVSSASSERVPEPRARRVRSAYSS